MKIHIYESDSDLAEVLTQAVEYLGYQTIVAKNSSSAQKNLFTYPADVIILSKHLAGNGAETIARTAKSRGVRIICIATDSTSVEPSDGFLREPFNLAELENAILNKTPLDG